MTPEIIGGLVRSLVVAIGGVVSALGYQTHTDWALLAGAIAALAMAVWGVWQHIQAERDRKRAFAVGVMTMPTAAPIAAPTIQEVREITEARPAAP